MGNSYGLSEADDAVRVDGCLADQNRQKALVH
jgi:hypothetical protein